MAAILHTTFSNAFAEIKVIVFLFKFVTKHHFLQLISICLGSGFVQQVFTWSNIDQHVWCRHILSLGLNKMNIVVLWYAPGGGSYSQVSVY